MREIVCPALLAVHPLSADDSPHPPVACCDDGDGKRVSGVSSDVLGETLVVEGNVHHQKRGRLWEIHARINDLQEGFVRDQGHHFQLK